MRHHLSCAMIVSGIRGSVMIEDPPYCAKPRVTTVAKGVVSERGALCCKSLSLGVLLSGCLVTTLS